MKNTLLISCFFCAAFFCAPAFADITVNQAVIQQGEAVRVSVTPAEKTKSAYLVFHKRRWPLFPAPDGSLNGFVAVDPDTAPQKYRIQFYGRTSDNVLITMNTVVTVKKGVFPTSRIEIPKAKKAASAPSTIMKESNLIGPLFAQVSTAKRWSEFLLLPVNGPVTTPYGASRVYDNGRLAWWHRGVDIYNKKGTPIHAPSAGKILFSKTLISHGNTIMIDHGQSVVSVFNHLQTRLVRDGDTVTRGQVIGLLGDTGIATGPHLHWGLSVGNVRVDPMRWVKKTPPAPKKMQ